MIPWRDGALIGALSLSMASGSTGTYLLASLSPFLVDALALSAGTIGLLVFATYVTAACMSGPLGRLGDRADPVFVLLIGASASVLSTALFAAAGPWTLIAFTVFSGVAMASANPGTNGLAARRLPPRQMALAIGIKQSGATGTGLFLSASVPGLALLLGWRAAALIALVIPLLTFGTALLTWRPPVRLARHHPAAGTVAVSSRWLTALSQYAFLLGIATGISNGFLVLYANTRLGFGPVEAGLVFTTFTLTSVLARVIWVRMADRGAEAGTLFVLIALSAALSPVLLLLAPVLSAQLIWPAAALAGLSVVGWNALGMITILNRVGPQRVGSASGKMLRAFFIGLAAGPVAFGVLVERTGYPWGWALELIVLGAAAIHAVRLKRHLRTPER